MVFTPKHEVYSLPPQATGYDFAAALNPDMLRSGTAISINGVRQPLDTVLPNAAVVEVLFEGSGRPFNNITMGGAAMPRTRRMIGQIRRKEQWQHLVASGRASLERELMQRGLFDLSDLERINDDYAIRVQQLRLHFGCERLEDLYFRIGQEGPSIFNRVVEQLNALHITKDELCLTSIRLQGIDKPGVLARAARIVAESGGNICSLYLDSDDNTYELRLVVDALDEDDECAIRDNLNADEALFEQVEVV